MLNTDNMFLALVFSSIGLGYFVYGKKQKRLVPLLSGIALMVYTSFVSGAYAMTGIGLVLLALPFVLKR